MVAWREINGGDVLNVFFAVIIAAFSLGQAGPNVQALSSGAGAAANIFSVIERVPAIDAYSEEGKRVDQLRGQIELRGVKFHYPSRPDVPVLHHFSLTVEEGETVALVGESGSGKSTIIQLLERYYDPVEGSVLVDGVDIREYHIQSYREHLALVQQEPVLFSASIAENVSLGMPDARPAPSHDQVVDACTMANAKDFIERLPEKYATLVGERGGLLSGGQRQRVAIARALVKDPKVRSLPLALP
jgi:ABC-type multidrug transport system fused ATPase/permease subunit